LTGGIIVTNTQQILEHKGQELHTVRPDDTVLDAIKVMAKEDVGAVLVVSGDALVGIFTERQYTRKVFLEGRASPTTLIRDVMETEILYVGPDQSAEDCMALMTEKRIRHLPILSDGRLLGIVSIGDLMRNIIEQRQFDIDHLVQYVRG
jgi:CBS domain-containing protein